MAEGHRERLRQRFLNESIDSIPEYVVLEMMLQGVIVRKDTCEMARRLLREFGCLASVIDAPLDQIMKVPGIGEAAAYQLKLLPKFYRKYRMSKRRGNIVFENTELVGEYLVDRFIGYNDEAIFLICMDENMRFIDCALVAEGTINAVEVNIRKIMEIAIKYNARRVILAHNHPNGSVLPSPDDIESTRKIAHVLDMAGVILDDHIIVAGEDYTSIFRMR